MKLIFCLVLIYHLLALRIFKCFYNHYVFEFSWSSEWFCCFQCLQNLESWASDPDGIIEAAYQIKYNPSRMKQYVFFLPFLSCSVFAYPIVYANKMIDFIGFRLRQEYASIKTKKLEERKELNVSVCLHIIFLNSTEKLVFRFWIKTKAIFSHRKCLVCSLALSQGTFFREQTFKAEACLTGEGKCIAVPIC